jgi:hypothetical protein
MLEGEGSAVRLFIVLHLQQCDLKGVDVREAAAEGSDSTDSVQI